MQSIAIYKKNITIDLKVDEDDLFYYIYFYINDVLVKTFRGKDLYKLKDKAYNYIRYTYNIILI